MLTLHHDIRIFCMAFIILLSNVLLGTKYKLLPSFMMWQNINKDWNIFLNFFGEVTPLVFKNNLRIILGSQSEKFTNIEARKKFRHSYKKNCKIHLISINIHAGQGTTRYFYDHRNFLMASDNLNDSSLHNCNFWLLVHSASH